MPPRLPIRKELPFEFVYQLFSLLISLIVVHAIYVALIRPRAATVFEEQALRVQQDAAYVPEQSLYVVLRDLEQEACFVLMLWAVALVGYKGYEVLGERMLLRQNLVPISAGTKVLPEDARSLARSIEALPGAVTRSLLPKTLLAALHRFESTRSISDASETVQALCNAEGDRLDSELSMIRYIVWAIPSIGFIGTVRGIGQALGFAYRAMEGDISGVTRSLGVAFNSTFVALVLSLLLMLLVHQLQLLQERLVLETRDYCDQHLISHMQIDSRG